MVLIILSDSPMVFKRKKFFNSFTEKIKHPDDVFSHKILLWFCGIGTHRLFSIPLNLKPLFSIRCCGNMSRKKAEARSVDTIAVTTKRGPLATCEYRPRILINILLGTRLYCNLWQRIIQPKMSLVLRLRHPALKIHLKCKQRKQPFFFQFMSSFFKQYTI